ncbi:MAG: SPASM domain-containing protein [Synergistaceae bacterium]|nr:SPASM domain-containing protein [Synergistaceae bacterium]
MSRGGQSPNKLGNHDTRAVNIMCALPFRQLIIRPTGEVSLCCNDALGKYTLGDLRTQTISEVWHSERYEAVRAEMIANARKNLKLCCECDTIAGFGLFTERKRPYAVSNNDEQP